MTSSSLPALERGRACLRCRRRKMRCDGLRPTCGPCTRAEEPECEYTDAGPTPSQVLERNVADLEARIRELEGQSSDVITLRDPHAAYRERANLVQTIQSYSDNPFEQSLLSTFLDRASSFGFFLDIPRFKSRMANRSSASPISTALLKAMQLLALPYIHDPRWRTREPQLMTQVVQGLAAATAHIDPARMIDILQAEVLVAGYFFSNDRKLEGGYHITAAVSIAVACNLHRIRSPNVGIVLTAFGGVHHRLPASVDDIEEGERIRGFWTVYCLDRCWTIALKSQSVLSRGDVVFQIETPWPLESTVYEQGLYTESLKHRNIPTVKHFLESTSSSGWDRSQLALNAQASTLFEHAADLTSQWKPTASDFQAKFLALDNRIQHFKRSLPGLASTGIVTSSMEASTSQNQQATQLNIDRLRILLCCHTLAHCATIQLHMALPQPHIPINSRALTAAITAANLLGEINANAIGFVDPIMGVLWSTLCQVLVHGLNIIRRLHFHQGSSGRSTPTVNTIPHLPGEIIITSALDRVQTVLEALSRTSPLLERELANLRQARFDMQVNA